MDRHTLTLTAIQEGLREKRFSCRELTQSYLDAIHAQDPALHAFLHVDAEEALQQADTVDADIAAGKNLSPLAGQPAALKDVIVTKAMPTTAGSKILEGYRAPYNASVVDTLLDAGTVILGKTNCDEFAMGASGENSAFSTTKNPWDQKYVPGGSSSGSAAAVAAGECVFALGSDTGGSVRQPAGFCGIVGVKPTYGRISRYGLIALASSLDQIGIFARTVEDAAVVLNGIAGKDERDATSVAQPPINLEAVRSADIAGLTIGVPKEYFVEGMDPDVERTVRDAIRALERCGAKTIPISLPHTEYALAVYYLILPAEASANLARYDGIRFGNRVPAADLTTTYLASRSAGFGKEVQRRIMLGTYALSAGYYDAYYLKAQKVRTLIRQDFANAFRQADLLITPTSPSLPFRLGEKTADPLTMYLADMFTVSANIAGLPGINVPVGWVKNLPVGVQLLGPLWSEKRMFTAARALEQTLALPLRIPE